MLLCVLSFYSISYFHKIVCWHLIWMGFFFRLASLYLTIASKHFTNQIIIYTYLFFDISLDFESISHNSDLNSDFVCHIFDFFLIVVALYIGIFTAHNSDFYPLNLVLLLILIYKSLWIGLSANRPNKYIGQYINNNKCKLIVFFYLSISQHLTSLTFFIFDYILTQLKINISFFRCDSFIYDSVFCIC